MAARCGAATKYVKSVALVMPRCLSFSGDVVGRDMPLFSHHFFSPIILHYSGNNAQMQFPKQ